MTSPKYRGFQHTGQKGENVSVQQLDDAGIEAICQRIEAGETQREIAASYSLDVAALNRWLHATPEKDQRTARAKVISAEAWLDRGLEAVAQALPKSGQIDASAARAYAQECARRAAIRNPAYRDGHKVEVSGQVSIADALREARAKRKP